MKSWPEYYISPSLPPWFLISQVPPVPLACPPWRSWAPLPFSSGGLHPLMMGTLLWPSTWWSARTLPLIGNQHTHEHTTHLLHVHTHLVHVNHTSFRFSGCRWSSIMKRVTEPSTIVEGLMPNAEYVFRVYAGNLIGSSQPSLETPVVSLSPIRHANTTEFFLEPFDTNYDILRILGR